MSEHKSVGRPPAGDGKFTTVLVCVTREEKADIDREWLQFKEQNNLPKLSKSAYLRAKLFQRPIDAD